MQENFGKKIKNNFYLRDFDQAILLENCSAMKYVKNIKSTML